MHYLRCTVHLRWWFKLYLWGLITTAYVSGRTPDPEKVGKVVRRAVVVRVVPVRFVVWA